jgi:hypothetical protein
MDTKIIASKAPLVATGIFVFADFSQIVRMINEQTSAGQSLVGWIGILVALVMYATFFRVITPKEKLAFYCTVVNIAVIITLALTVAYFRYWS